MLERSKREHGDKKPPQGLWNSIIALLEFSCRESALIESSFCLATVFGWLSSSLPLLSESSRPSRLLFPLHAPRRPRPGVRPASRLRPSLARLAPRKTLWHSP